MDADGKLDIPLTSDNFLVINGSNLQKLATFLPSQNLAVGIFEFIFQEVTFILTRLAERVIASITAGGQKDIQKEISKFLEHPCELYEVVLKLLEYLAHSEHKELLIPFYYRVFIAKCGIRSKIFVADFLKRSKFLSFLCEKFIDYFILQ